MARPTDYTPELVERARNYAFTGDDFDAVPTVERLALILGVSRETIYAWAKEYPEFSDIVSYLRTRKSFELQNKALKNQVNASIAKLLLGHEGYRENQDVTTDGKAMPAQVLVRFLGDEKDE